MSNSKEQNFFQVSNDNQKIKPLSIFSPNYSVNFFVSDIENKYIRSYIKIQEVIASTGGIIKFFTLLFSLVNNYFARFSLIEESYRTLICKNVDILKNSTRNRLSKSHSESNLANIVNNLNGNLNNTVRKNNENPLHVSPTELTASNLRGGPRKKDFLRILTFWEKLQIFPCIRTIITSKKLDIYDQIDKSMKESADIINLFIVQEKTKEFFEQNNLNQTNTLFNLGEVRDVTARYNNYFN